MIFGSLNKSSIRRGVYVYVYWLTRENGSHSKSEFQMFSLISGRHVCVP